ncbi:TetR family transcriptional regulator [Tistrella bauzanensis]|nr:TetR family transcriptional regulator [Tistrella bauzanensis]
MTDTDRLTARSTTARSTQAQRARTRPARRRERGEETRALLLDEAERLFAAHGFHGVGLAALAAARGLGNAGLLHHFPSKARLYGAVLARVGAELDALLDAALADAGGPRDAACAMVRVQATWTAERPQGARLVLRELLDNLDRVGRARSLPLAGYVDRMCRVIEAAQAAGHVAAGPVVLPLTQLLGGFAYALAVRPTFAQMRPQDAVLASDAAFVDALVALAEAALFTGGHAHADPDAR